MALRRTRKQGSKTNNNNNTLTIMAITASVRSLMLPRTMFVEDGWKRSSGGSCFQQSQNSRVKGGESSE